MSVTETDSGQNREQKLIDQFLADTGTLDQCPHQVGGELIERAAGAMGHSFRTGPHGFARLAV